MNIVFKPENHEYVSLDGDIKWSSVTSLISKYKGKFDADAQALKSSKNKKSKWYGLSVQQIKELWSKESKRATDLGTWYHNQRENDICGLETLGYEGKNLSIIKPTYEQGNKLAPNQKLQDGYYPEHMVYLKSARLCGQSDLVIVNDGLVNITDFKSNKEIKMSSYVNWEGISEKMKSPLNHMDDCHFSHYSLQLSIYMYIILKHNPKLRPGKMNLQHVIFEEEGKDQYDYPITKLDSDGNPIVKEIVNYDIPYLKQEVISIINAN